MCIDPHTITAVKTYLEMIIELVHKSPVYVCTVFFLKHAMFFFSQVVPQTSMFFVLA